MSHALCVVIIILVLAALFWTFDKSAFRSDSFTLPFGGGYVYGPYYGGMADKEVEADSLMT